MKSMTKKGMTGQLVSVAYGIVALALMIGVGLIVLSAFGNSQGAGTVNTTLVTIAGYLGTGSGGLASWIPALIALFVGILFLSYFAGKSGKSY